MRCMRSGGNIVEICRCIEIKFLYFGRFCHNLPLSFMQDKEISLSFNSHDFIATQKYIWSYSNRKFIKSTILYILISVVVLVMGLAVDKKSDFSFSITFGAGYLFYILFGVIGYIERRVRFFNKAKSFVKRNGNDSIDCSYKFTDNYIEYEDKEKLYRLSWHLFKPHVVSGDNILLILKDQTAITFIFNKKELGDNEYNELRNIVNNKIG